VTLNTHKGIKQNYVASLLEMEQKGLVDALNLLGLVHKLFLPYCGPFFLVNELPAKGSSLGHCP
jgi:hypothetical protein